MDVESSKGWTLNKVKGGRRTNERMDVEPRERWMLKQVQGHIHIGLLKSLLCIGKEGLKEPHMNITMEVKSYPGLRLHQAEDGI